MNIWLANTIIEIAWLAATCFLIYTEHYIWGGITLVGAFISGYSERRTSG